MVSFFACVCLFPPMPKGEEKSLAGDEAGGESEEKFAGFPSMSPSDLLLESMMTFQISIGWPMAMDLKYDDGYLGLLFKETGFRFSFSSESVLLRLKLILKQSCAN